MDDLMGVRAWDQGAQALEECIHAHGEPASSVFPWSLELERDGVARQESQASVRERGAKEVSAQVLESLTIVLAHYRGGIEALAVHARLASPGVVTAIGVELRVLLGISVVGRMRGGSAARGRA